MAQAELKITGDFEELAELLASLRKDGLTVTVGDPEPAFTEPKPKPEVTGTVEDVLDARDKKRRDDELSRMVESNGMFIRQPLVQLIMMQMEEYKSVSKKHLEDVRKRHNYTESSVASTVSKLKKLGVITKFKTKGGETRFKNVPENKRPTGYDKLTEAQLRSA